VKARSGLSDWGRDRRGKMRFSERYGHKEARHALQRDSMERGLRNRIWDGVYLHFCKPLLDWGDLENVHEAPGGIGVTLYGLWHEHLKRPWDTIDSETVGAAVEALRDYFFSREWWAVYDLLEYLAEELDEHYGQRLIGMCNRVLDEEKSAYRFVGTQIAEITSEEEIKAIESALAKAEPLAGVRTHLQTALELYKRKPKAEYRNSIKESVSAVEALACLITDEPKATLGKALDKIEQQGQVKIHGALKKAFGILYGYTSDEDGVRHKMLEEGRVGRAEALYMLVACSAFVSYLVSKAADAGMDLTTG